SSLHSTCVAHLSQRSCQTILNTTVAADKSLICWINWLLVSWPSGGFTTQRIAARLECKLAAYLESYGKEDCRHRIPRHTTRFGPGCRPVGEMAADGLPDPA